MKKILAIDDNDINLELLNQLITRHYPSFQFLKANNGDDGITLTKTEKPELILLDILMPGLNGYEVCEILKKDNSTRHIPVLMISALGGNPAERTKGLNAGADAFISKPFVTSELQAQINVALRIKSVEDLLRKRNESLELSIKSETNKFMQKEERFHQISEHARQFYWEIDENGDFVYISPVVETILQLKPLDILGKINFSQLFLSATANRHIQVPMYEELQEAEIVLKAGNKDLWLTLSSFPIFDKTGNFAGARGICFDITKRKLAELALIRNMKKVEKYQQKLKKLNIEITRIEENERRRIAENLHDSLGQTLSLAYLKLSAINTTEFSPATQNIYNDTFSLLSKAIAESRSLTYDLSPPILYELGLVPAFKWQLEVLEQKEKVKTQLIGEEINLNVKKEIIIFIYRIVNELIQNVIKHAKATEVSIEITQVKRKYYISVRDNGAGFDSNNRKITSKTGGFGLLSIKERIENFKGHFYIHSEPGKGTLAKIEIPEIK
ncbi:MAG: response regulator [Draconibacterium sp.]